jgi:hypothetical protein
MHFLVGIIVIIICRKPNCSAAIVVLVYCIARVVVLLGSASIMWWWPHGLISLLHRRSSNTLAVDSEVQRSAPNWDACWQLKFIISESTWQEIRQVVVKINVLLQLASWMQEAIQILRLITNTIRVTLRAREMQSTLVTKQQTLTDSLKGIRNQNEQTKDNSV